MHCSPSPRGLRFPCTLSAVPQRGAGKGSCKPMQFYDNSSLRQLKRSKQPLALVDSCGLIAICSTYLVCATAEPQLLLAQMYLAPRPYVAIRSQRSTITTQYKLALHSRPVRGAPERSGRWPDSVRVCGRSGTALLPDFSWPSCHIHRAPEAFVSLSVCKHLHQ